MDKSQIKISTNGKVLTGIVILGSITSTLLLVGCIQFYFSQGYSGGNAPPENGNGIWSRFFRHLHASKMPFMLGLFAASFRSLLGNLPLGGCFAIQMRWGLDENFASIKVRAYGYACGHCNPVLWSAN